MSVSRTSALAIAGRYASAAFALAADAKKEAVVTEELSQLADAMAHSAELRAALANPLLGNAAKAAILADIAKKADPLTLQVLATVAEGGRADVLPAIAEALRAKLAAARGELIAEVTSARPLSAAMQKQLVQSLATATGKQVQLQMKNDPAVLGGVAIQLGSLRLDATLAGALTQMRADLLAQTA